MKHTPEDLIQTVVAADTIRRQHVSEPISRYPAWKRTWIEPWFNLLGLLIGQGLSSLPWVLRWRADQRINFLLGGRQSAEPANLKDRCAEFASLAGRLRQETGQWPATLVFTSHPVTTGQHEWIRFEAMREGLLLANAVVEKTSTGLYRPAPQCFLAIDPYALDTLPTSVSGVYAGFMYRTYLAWDRMSDTQGALQRWLLLRGSGYARIFFRILKRLRRGVPVVMVIPGGLPFNSRLLYAAREFVHRLTPKRWPYSKRLAQKKWMSVLMQPVEGVLPLLSGTLPESTRTSLLQLLSEWGFSAVEQRPLLEAFAEEFKRDVPYRERLFRALFNRLVEKGKPLMWIALAHAHQEPYLRVSAPWAAYKAANGKIRIIRGAMSVSEAVTDVKRVAMDFSKEFVV